MSASTLSTLFLRNLLHVRPADGHKGTFGHALLIAGQYGMAGAALLAARACIRSGVGKVTVHTPRSNNVILQLGVPEAIVHFDAHHEHFTSLVALDAYDAMAIGPGLGTAPDTLDAVRRQLTIARRGRCVLDADALNALALRPELFRLIPPESILTPHPAEYKRICGNDAPSEFSRRYAAILVLKGHPTRIFTPAGEVYECPWGNSGMATAGSGDVLTGIITSLLAQGHSPLHSALLGVGLHALAGDAASYEKGEHSVISSDLIEYLPAAFKQISWLE